MIMVQPIVCSDIKYLGVNGTISSNGHYEYPDVPPASHLLSLLQNKIKLNDWEFYQAYKQGVYVFPKTTDTHYDVTYYKDRKDALYGTDTIIRFFGKWYKTGDDPIENGFRNDDNTWTSLGRSNEALIAKAQGDNNFTIDKEGVTFDYLGKVVSKNTISISSKKADSAGHYQYPNIPPASYLLSSLQNQIKLNDWEFYQAYKQGIYVFPKKTSWDNYIAPRPPLSAYYYEVKFEKGRTINTPNGKMPYEAYIVWHRLSNGSDAPIENGIINDDNTWTSTDEAGYLLGRFYTVDVLGQTFDYLGNLVGSRMVDSSTTPSTVRIPAPPLTGGDVILIT